MRKYIVYIFFGLLLSCKMVVNEDIKSKEDNKLTLIDSYNKKELKDYNLRYTRYSEMYDMDFFNKKNKSNVYLNLETALKDSQILQSGVADIYILFKNKSHSPFGYPKRFTLLIDSLNNSKLFLNPLMPVSIIIDKLYLTKNNMDSLYVKYENRTYIVTPESLTNRNDTNKLLVSPDETVTVKVVGYRKNIAEEILSEDIKFVYDKEKIIELN